MLLTHWYTGLSTARSRDDALHAPHHPPPIYDPSEDVYLHVRLPCPAPTPMLIVSQKRESAGSQTTIWDEDYIHLHLDSLH